MKYLNPFNFGAPSIFAHKKCAKIKGGKYLPKTFSRRFISVDEAEIQFPKRIQKRKYLDGIHPFLPQEDEELDVGILIGGNCPRALEPIEVIACQGDGPFAFRSVLGWCVIGLTVLH